MFVNHLTYRMCGGSSKPCIVRSRSSCLASMLPKEVEEVCMTMADTASPGANSIKVKLTTVIRNTMGTEMRNRRKMYLSIDICPEGSTHRDPMVVLENEKPREGQDCVVSNHVPSLYTNLLSLQTVMPSAFVQAPPGHENPAIFTANLRSTVTHGANWLGQGISSCTR